MRPKPATLSVLDLAYAHHQAGRLSDAEQEYRRALEIDPGYAPAYDNLGVVLKDMGRLEDSVAEHRRAIEADPTHSDGHYNLGVVLTLLERGDEAREHYMQALLIRPNDADAMHNLGVLLMGQGRLDEAERCLRGTIKLNPNFIDARVHLGALLIEQGLPMSAIQCLQAALAIDPRHANALNNLGIILLSEGRDDEALKLFRDGLARDPANASARHMVAAMSGVTTGTAPRDYVVKLFDLYAHRFDFHLTGNLAYRVPTLLRLAVERLSGARCHFHRAIDLGCGTGLVGENFKDVTDAMDGIDLSPKMLEKAREKALYEKLYLGDVCEILDAWQTGGHRHDIALAADIFIYMGDLAPVFGSVRRALAPGGLFAFSVERFDGEGYVLRSSGRYAQSPAYIEVLARDHGFILEARDDVEIRMERGEAIPGDLFILRR